MPYKSHTLVIPPMSVRMATRSRQQAHRSIQQTFLLSSRLNLKPLIRQRQRFFTSMACCTLRDSMHLDRCVALADCTRAAQHSGHPLSLACSFLRRRRGYSSVGHIHWPSKRCCDAISSQFRFQVGGASHRCPEKNQVSKQE
jgi:hypothetical protein